MARKSLADQRAEKLAQMEALKKELASLEAKAGERIGRLAVRAGLADLNLDDETLVKAFAELAGRFQGKRPKEPAASVAPAADPA